MLKTQPILILHKGDHYMRESFEYEGTTTGEYAAVCTLLMQAGTTKLFTWDMADLFCIPQLRMRTLLFRLMMADICYRQICAIHC